MAKRRRYYLSYLLRLWRTGSGKNAVWRASLENPFTGELEGFASPVDLFAFLQARINTADHKAEETIIDDDDGDDGDDDRQSRHKGASMDCITREREPNEKLENRTAQDIGG